MSCCLSRVPLFARAITSSIHFFFSPPPACRHHGVMSDKLMSSTYPQTQPTVLPVDVPPANCTLERIPQNSPFSRRASAKTEQSTLKRLSGLTQFFRNFYTVTFVLSASELCGFSIGFTPPPPPHPHNTMSIGSQLYSSFTATIRTETFVPSPDSIGDDDIHFLST